MKAIITSAGCRMFSKSNRRTPDGHRRGCAAAVSRSVTRRIAAATLCLCLSAGGTFTARGADWPTYRGGVDRSGVTPESLDGELHLHWTLELPEPRRAWPPMPGDDGKLDFDRSYAPVAAHGLLFVPSMVNDRLSAYDLDTGIERWRYYTDGPIRLAPAVADGKVFVASDDGRLHALDAASGRPLWSYFAAGSDRRVLGNGRIISLWPARGGPVVADGTVYFAAGLWPNEGIFICALDAETGAERWVNSGVGPTFQLQQHFDAYAYGGPAPQGHLVVAGDALLVPGGRTPPAVFDRHTGELRYFIMATERVGKGAGGHQVFVQGEWYFNLRDRDNVHLYRLADGEQLWEAGGWMPGDPPDSPALATQLRAVVRPGIPGIHVVDATGFMGVVNQRLVVYDPQVEATGDKVLRTGFTSPRYAERGTLRERYALRKLYESEAFEGLERLHLRAGSVVYGSGRDGWVYAIALRDGAQAPRQVGSHQVSAPVFDMLAADGRLIVVTEKGSVYCFGPGRREAVRHALAVEPLTGREDRWAAQAETLLAEMGDRGGYALMPDAGSGRLMEEILLRSELHLVVLAREAGQVASLRQRLDDAGLYGTRAVVHHAETPVDFDFPLYVPSLVLMENMAAAGLDDDPSVAAQWLQRVRPYGGRVFFPLASEAQDRWVAALDAEALPQARWSRTPEGLVIERAGALPGAGEWTHQYADSGNTSYSSDARVKAPLGVLWYGTPPGVVINHKPGITPRVAGGRLIRAISSHVWATCVYTGRVLWNRSLPRDERIRPAGDWDTGALGSPLVMTADSLYLLLRDHRCRRLDAATGEILGDFEMPDRDRLRQHPRDPAMESILESYGARLQEMGAGFSDPEITGAAVDRLVALYPFAHSYLAAESGRAGEPTENIRSNPEAFGTGALEVVRGMRGRPESTIVFEIEGLDPGEYFVGFFGAVSTHRHHRPAHHPIRVHRLAVDGRPVALRTHLLEREPERFGLPYLYFEDREMGTLVSAAPVRMDEKARVEIEVHGHGLSVNRLMLFRDREAVAGIPAQVAQFAAEHGTIRTFTGTSPRWGSLVVWDDTLIAGAWPLVFDDMHPPHNWNATSSEFVVAMDRASGAVRWVHQARYGFRHTAIIAADGKVFVIDHLSEEVRERMARRGIEPEVKPQIRALDIRTGAVLWTFDEEVFGTFLAYSQPHDVLVQAGFGGTGLPDEPRNRVMALQGRDGRQLWNREMPIGRGAISLHAANRQLLNFTLGWIGGSGPSPDLLTGETVQIEHPLTGEPVPMTFQKWHGCGTHNLSEHLAVFRSSTAAYLDMRTQIGTVNLSGFRTGCIDSLIPAEGLLNAPDYNAGCRCSYAMRTSLALVHRPEVDRWMSSRFPRPAPGTIRAAGINFGAPGSRMCDADRTLWIEYPREGDLAPDLPLQVTVHGDGRPYRMHGARIDAGDGGVPWVASSGLEGIRTVRVEGLDVATAPDGRPAAYAVRIHFAEPDRVQPGERTFDVFLQEERVIDGLDIVGRTAVARRALVVEFADIVPVDNALTIRFEPTEGMQHETLVSGIEFRRQP